MPQLKVPAGFSIELAAGPPLVERPIVASFDDEGRLYVAESSGSNDPVQKQLELKPHRIVRLEDSDGDGKFDKRTVFADRMMFPEGCLWFEGSVYVAAPPSIWKLTDKDGDGAADERVEWFQGKTLTGCANDLHGPYAGPDGFLYWCKGAFAEQTHVVNGKEWKTKAAHIFRMRPDGTDFEPVMTGGMDNPVDVAFMPNGERILSGTFFHVNPRYDGLIHAIYGGVYGKDHGVLDGHPRTGELMPILDPIPAAAGAGLERYDSNVFGPEYRDNLFLCQFNLRKVSRHVLKPSGATYKTEDSDFVTSDFVDFHPTDVQVDADGSLLVIDTGGWYKLCCPTSQLWKPDVLGGIYRVRKIGAKPPADPRGRKIEWAKQAPAQLWSLIGDDRSAVSRCATREFVRRKNSPEIETFLKSEIYEGSDSLPEDYDRITEDATAPATRRLLLQLWALSQIETAQSRKLLWEMFLCHGNENTRHVVMQSLSLHRGEEGEVIVNGIATSSKDAANRRLAAEVLGRIGKRFSIVSLLGAAETSPDRVLQHSIIYALIELADPVLTRKHGLNSQSPPRTVAAALIALDQMPAGDIKAADVVPHLGAKDETLRDAAGWVVRQHPEWGGDLAQYFAQQLKAIEPIASTAATPAATVALEEQLVLFATHPAVQQLLADAFNLPGATAAQRATALRVMARVKLKGMPDSWKPAIGKALVESAADQLPLAMAAARQFPTAAATDPKLSKAITAIAESDEYPLNTRVEAIDILVGKRPQLTETQFKLLERSQSADTEVAVRSASADAISKSQLAPEQLDRLCAIVQSAGPLELNRLLKPFDREKDDALGLKLIESLKKSPSLASLRVDVLREALAKYGPNVQNAIVELESLVNVDSSAQRKHIEELMPLVTKGDVRRGHAVFYSSKAACSSCHRMGAAGGTTGPDLTHVGNTRTERDLLESILYPSLSFVRSYEPVVVTTQDGKVINGLIRNESAKEYVLATGPDQEARIARDEVDEIQPGTVSVMPAGLEKQLTPGELADLVMFLKDGAGREPKRVNRNPQR
jgi:putative membrane-bound dehydrogenase-like protein